MSSPTRIRKHSTLKLVLICVFLLLLLVVGFGILGAVVGDPEDKAPAVANAPEQPDAATVEAYLADLRKIDPAIVGDKSADTIVDRGRSQCTSIAEFPDDEAKLVDLTNQRFTAPGHPEGFGPAKAAKILATVRKHLCP